MRAQQDLLDQKRQEQQTSGTNNNNNNTNEDTEEEDGPPVNWATASVKGGLSGTHHPSTTTSTSNPNNTTRLHARLVQLPPSRFKSSLSRLQARDVGQMWQVAGTVVRASPIQMYESTRTYLCQPTNTNNTKKNTSGNNNTDSSNGGGGGRRGGWKTKKKQDSSSCGCGKTFVVHANLGHVNNALTPPEVCPLWTTTTNTTTPNAPPTKVPCRGTNLVALDPSVGSIHTDYQELKIQESSNHHNNNSSNQELGHIPRSLVVKLQHDLVDTCQPGDQVVIVGSLLAQWHSDVATHSMNPRRGSHKHNGKQQQAQGPPPSVRNVPEPDIGLALLAHSILVLSDDPRASSTAGASSSSSSITAVATNHAHTEDTKRYQAEFERYWQLQVPRPIAARDFICRAVCPKLYGLPMIKLALLLTLIGGVSSDSSHNSNIDNIMQETDPIIDGMTEDKENTRETDQQQQHQQHQDLFVIPRRHPKNHSSLSQEPGLDYNSLYANDNNNQPPKRRRHNTNTTRTGVEDDAQPPSQQQHHQQEHSSQMTNHLPTAPRQTPNHRSNAQVYTRRRSQSHLLLVGDPGTGKSQFLRFAAALSPRAVLTTGVGTTSAGLTCAAVRHGSSGEFALEAGALVLADQGVCCIDEFGCIRDQDRLTIHEAMEQQHLSVAKAGIVCKLNCRATIIAVMNPRDCLYDNQCSLSVNTGLGTPLLSRFDIILKLVDSSDATRDDNITTYLLNQAIQGTGPSDDGTPLLPQSNGDGSSMSSPFVPEPWSMEKLRAYISIVRDTLFPVLSDEAALLLERHYEACRGSQSRTIPVTVRFLESLIRLSQAHARLLFRDHVLLLDAVAVIRVMECSAFCYGGFDCPSTSSSSYPGGGSTNHNVQHESLYQDPMNVDFSTQPDLELCCFEFHILKRYNMLHYMSPERQSQAQAELQHRTQPDEHQDQGWADYLEGQPYTMHSMPPPPPPAGPSLWDGSHDSHQTMPPPYEEPIVTLTQVQDHYGRTHYSQAVHDTASQHPTSTRQRRRPD